MNVLELLVGRLALDRQLISEPLLQHCLQGGLGLGEMLVSQGFPPDTVHALFAEAQQAQLLCTGCGSRFGVAHLIPHDPWSCRNCGQELVVLGNEDSRRLGTGRWVAGVTPDQYPTSTGSHRVMANTPGIDTRPGSGRWQHATPPTHHGVAPTGSGSGGWQGSGSGFSVSQRFRSKLQPGTVLDGHEIISELGRGGMGIVFKARHMGRGDLVALKVLLAGAMATERQQKRFQREAEALAKLSHPNVVRVFDMGDLGDHMYFTMEFVDGQPLSDQIKDDRISLRRAVEIARDVARGLQHAHEQEIIHRDIKPDNILIDQSGTPLITDFGLVRDASNDVSRLTRSGAVLGTPYYMSPEQASGQGHHLTGAADVYSLGTVLYQMLTGELPFDGATQIELTKKIVELPAPRPSKTNDAVPPELDAIVLKSLAKSPDDRYHTAADFADDLERFLRGEQVQARPPAPISKQTLLKGAAVLLFVALLGLGVGLGVRRWRNRPPEGDPPEKPPAVDGKAAAARKAALDKVDDLLREAERTPIGVYRAALWKVVTATDEALKVAPEVARLHLARGFAHMRLQKWDEARASLAKAVELDPRGEVGARAAYLGARLISRADGDEAKAAKLLERWEQGAKVEGDQIPGPWHGLARALHVYYDDNHDVVAALRLVEQAEARAEVEIAQLDALKSKLLFARGDMNGAFDLLQQALRIDPKDASSWATRASFYAVVKDDTEQALKDVEKALTLDPENTEALQMRGSIRLMTDDVVRGRRDLEQVLQRRPASELALRNMVILDMRDDPARGKERMRRAEQASPREPSVYLLECDMALEHDQLDEGLLALARGVEAVWGDRAVRARLMARCEELSLGARRIETMRTIAKQLDDKHPGNPYSKVLRGHAAGFESHDFKACLDHWHGCQRADRDAVYVWERRLRIMVSLQGSGSSDVQREFDRFIAAARQVKSAAGLAYAARFEAVVRKREAAARRLAAEAAAVDPLETEAWLARGFVELVHDQVTTGYRYLQRAVAMAPESAEGYYLLGRAELERGKVDAAVRDFQRSVMLNPFSLEQLRMMCALLLRAKRYKAVINLTNRNGRKMQALELSPTPILVLHRAHAFAKLGKPGPAMSMIDNLMRAVKALEPSTQRYLAQVLADVGRKDDAKKVIREYLAKQPGDRQAQDLLRRLEGGN